MSSPLDPNEDLRQQLYARQDQVKVTLKEAKKVLRRDWDQLTPGERSAQSRAVKELEKQIDALEEEIEMNRPQLP